MLKVSELAGELDRRRNMKKCPGKTGHFCNIIGGKSYYIGERRDRDGG